MITDHTVESLKAFELDIAEEFNAGHIRAPVHLDGGNEQQLLDGFKDIKPNDWVCGSWRQHYKCLLKGVPPAELKAEIMAGRSIALCFPEYKVISSAIVGGILPIALGIAWEIKRRGGNERVHCFLGDMSAEAGMAWECMKYSANFHLPIKWIIEWNGLSVCTDTATVWGLGPGPYTGIVTHGPKSTAFKYTLTYPHSGAGKRVEF